MYGGPLLPVEKLFRNKLFIYFLFVLYKKNKNH